MTDRLDEDLVERILLRFRAKADIIIISGAPPHQSPAALFWGRAAEGTLNVVEAGETSLDRVQEAMRNLSFAAAAVIGTVLGRRRRLSRLSLRRRKPKPTPAPKPQSKAQPRAGVQGRARARARARTGGGGGARHRAVCREGEGGEAVTRSSTGRLHRPWDDARHDRGFTDI